MYLNAPPRPMMAPIARGVAFRPTAVAPFRPATAFRPPAMAMRPPVMRTAPMPQPQMARWAADRMAAAEARRRALALRQTGQDARIRTAVDAAVAARMPQQMVPANSSVVYPTAPGAMPAMPPAPSSVQPGSAEADLTPHQDAASDAAEAAAPSPAPKSKKTLFIVGGVLVAAVVGVVVVKKIRSGKKTHRGE